MATIDSQEASRITAAEALHLAGFDDFSETMARIYDGIRRSAKSGLLNHRYGASGLLNPYPPEKDWNGLTRRVTEALTADGFKVTVYYEDSSPFSSCGLVISWSPEV